MGVEKEDVKVMMMKLKFAPRTMDMEFFYPRFFQKTLNKPFETLTMKMKMDDYWKSFNVETNFENMKMEMTRGPGGKGRWKQTFHFIATRNGEMMSEYNLKYDIGMMQKPTTFEAEYTLNEKSMTHRMLCDYSTHLCFKNLKESFMFNPKTYNMDHTITKDTKNVLDFHTKFENGKLKSFIWNTPYLVPFYRYMTTRRSLFNRYFNPMPMLLTPFEVKVDVAGITKNHHQLGHAQDKHGDQAHGLRQIRVDLQERPDDPEVRVHHDRQEDRVRAVQGLEGQQEHALRLDHRGRRPSDLRHQIRPEVCHLHCGLQEHHAGPGGRFPGETGVDHVHALQHRQGVLLLLELGGQGRDALCQDLQQQGQPRHVEC